MILTANDRYVEVLFGEFVSGAWCHHCDRFTLGSIDKVIRAAAEYLDIHPATPSPE